MPRSCCVVSCCNNTRNCPEKGFYIIPHDKDRRKAWLRAINRADIDEEGVVVKSKTWSPKTRYHYVCSDHFKSGKKSNSINDPDYVPSLFPHTKKNISISNSPQKLTGFDRHKRRLRKVADEASSKRKLELIVPAVIYNSDHDDISCSNDVEIPGPSSPPLSLNSPISESEREGIYMEMDNLRKERNELKERVELLVSGNPFDYQRLCGNPDISMMLTGLEFHVLISLFQYLTKSQTEDLRSKLKMEDQILMTLVKLRHNLSFELLSYISGVSKSTSISYFWKWIDIMYAKLKFLVKMQDRDHIFQTIPSVFKQKFPRVTSIIDCFEVFMESPQSLLARAQCYSSYKKHCTIKVMISCTPLGAVNFVSKCWGGRVSDIQIVKESGFCTTKYHMPGDQILADRGFTLVDDFAAGSGSELIIPAFTRGRSQLTAREVENTRKIASVRIHIERVIGLIKNRYTVLKGILPIRTIKKITDESLDETLASCDKIVTVCSALVNLGVSIVKKPL